MLEQRNLKSDVVALALLALTIFFALALVTYDPADPPARLVFPTDGEVRNWCGPAGAYVAHFLFTAIGVGAYFLVVSLAVTDSLLLRGRKTTEPVVRGIGWALSLVGLTTLLAMAAPGWSPGPVVGSGGYLGAAGRGLLEMHFAVVGSYILAFSVLIGGLLLCTDYALLHLAGLVFGRPLKACASVLAGAARSVGARNAEAAEEAEDEEEATSLKVRINGKESLEDEADFEEEDEEDDSETEEDEEEEEDEAEEEVEPAKPARGVKKRLADVLRIKPPQKNPREEVLEELEAASRRDEEFDYELPHVDLLLEGEPFCYEEQEKDVRRKAKILEKTFANFGLNVKVVEIETGPVIAQFEVELEAGLRLSKITSLADDLAIALRVPSVRVVAPIPGKNTVGIEVPNAERQLVRLREVMEEANGKVAKMRIPLYLGKDVSGKPMVVDLTTLPHLLIAGRTGTGKSVCLNSIIMSMLMTRRPEDVRMLLIDPKMVELSSYMRLPHLMHPVVTDMKKAEAILAWAVDKMEERYALLARVGVRHMRSYNQLGEEEIMDRLRPESDEERAQIPTHLPFIVIVADEMADLMMTAAKEVESHIIRLAQKSRAVGIHLILATQKPTVDVITGLIKSNLPARIAFQVASRTDSRVVLDEMGADKLLGNGDMLFLWPGTSTLFRGQGAFVSDDEINRVVDFVGTSEPQFVHELVHLPAAGKEQPTGGNRHQDDLYEAAVDVIIREGRGSVSLLQRALGIGYGRAARLIDYMAEDGIVGDYNGSQAREVLITLEQWAAMQGGEAAPAPTPTAPPRRVKPSPTAGALDQARPATPRRGRYVMRDPQPDDLDEEDEEEAAADETSAPWDEAEAAEEACEEDADEQDETSEDEYDDEEYDEEVDESDEAEYDEEEYEEDEEAEYEEEDEYEEEECDEEDLEEEEVKEKPPKRRYRAKGA